ncbi:methylenetetrahydrofolate reductase [NAD(P)H] [PVC group bacterium (ex Bugula neritina AB1)]|nr:methylenetetrahydrofolate reductase [NAD(P)H] [PVC group bacterium (ex Bugula neritina AB1)]
MFDSSIDLSLEFFPPKTEALLESLKKTLFRLKRYNPEYVSVTYGALGSNQEKSLSIVDHIQNKENIPTTAHFTCVGMSFEKAHAFLKELNSLGVSKVLALRGDIPSNVDLKSVFTDFRYASDLVSFISEKYPHFDIFVAGYPEKHPEAKSLETDIEHLKKKVDQGAKAVITQLFFDNDHFFRFRDKAQDLGIKCKIIPGIMPVTSYESIKKITQMCGVHLPKDLELFFSQDRNQQELDRFAVDFSLRQCEGLLEGGVDSFHLYTLNKLHVIENICAFLRKEEL